MAFPCLRIPPSKESCAPPDGNPKTQEIRHPHPAFLQNRLLAQLKSQRSINRFRILHGRQTDGDTFEAEDLVSAETVACAYADFLNHYGFFLPLAGITTVKQVRD